MKKYYFKTLLFGLAISTTTFTSCCQSEDATAPATNNAQQQQQETSTLIPDNQAGQTPTVDQTNQATGVVIPNVSSPTVEDGTNGTVASFNVSGVKDQNGNFVDLVGTDGASNGKVQNIWLEIDGDAKTVITKKSEEAETKSQADIVFLVDNSGSMGAEADAVASQIISWSQTLSQAVDCQFGCVGYGDNIYGVDGALNMTTVENISSFLNSGSGTYRTMHFEGDDANSLEQNATANPDYTNGSYNECGCLALHYADAFFNFRSGANRIYINFTDEPNQPYNYPAFSIETLNPASSSYNWNSSKGTVHSIFSSGGQESDYTGWYPTVASQLNHNEDPWKMADYTGGTKFFTNSSFTGFNLNQIEVTAAILNTYFLRFNLTNALKDGQIHHVKIVIMVDNNKYAVWEGDVQF